VKPEWGKICPKNGGNWKFTLDGYIGLLIGWIGKHSWEFFLRENGHEGTWGGGGGEQKL
jgi:hypothetical protein